MSDLNIYRRTGIYVLPYDDKKIIILFCDQITMSCLPIVSYSNSNKLISRYGMHVRMPHGIMNVVNEYPSSPNICYQVMAGKTMRVSECKDLRTKSRFYIHAPHIMNMAGCAKNDANQFSRNCSYARSTLTELLKCAACLGSGVVIHCGYCFNRPLGLQTLVDNIIYSLDHYRTPSPDARNPLVLIECAAGSANTGTKLGHRMEEIRYILDECLRKAPHYKNNIGICLDTCHLHAAGYSLSTLDNVDNFMKTIDGLGITDHTVLVHLNDSKDVLGSGLDRHETLLNGYAFNKNQEVLSALINSFYKRNFDILLEAPSSAAWSSESYDINLLQTLHDRTNIL
jgi:endonuclease IV